jgi:ferric-dicitrate binding protein FerR (iron transport regulator)
MTAPKCPYHPGDQVEFAYGEMDPKSAEAFSTHLESCPACRATVSDLLEAARLTRKVRQAPVPQAKRKQDFDVSSLGRKPAGWRRPVFWAPVAAAVAALILFIVLRPAIEPPAPVEPPSYGVTPPTPAEPREKPGHLKVEPPPVFARVIRTTGKVTKKSKAETTRTPLAANAKIRGGDILVASAKSTALLVMDDQSRILIGEKSSVQLETLSHRGDRLILDRGHVTCEVSPRQAERSFSIVAGFGTVRVTGTLFAVLKIREQQLVVGVFKGAVKVTRSDLPEAGFEVRDGEQISLAKKKAAVRLTALGKKMRGLMQPFLPGTPPAPAKDTPPAVEEKKPKPQEPPGQETKTEPREEAPDTIVSLVEHMYKDTRWIFDDLRADIARGRWNVVLHRLENYLADPESPSRDEAILLKAVCLEKLNRLKEAYQTYRHYLLKWPAGSRAQEAKYGLIRTRAGL